MNIFSFPSLAVILVAFMAGAWFTFYNVRVAETPTDGVGETAETSTESGFDAIDAAKEVKNIIEGKDDDTPVVDVATGATLNLSGQGLTSVPKYVFDRTGLEVLNLSGNALTGALPAEVRHLSKLRVLDLSDNNFTGVPAEIGQLSRLEVLDLSGNPITGLPYELGNLKSLKTLDLRNTNYSELDLGIIKKGLSADVEILI